MLFPRVKPFAILMTILFMFQFSSPKVMCGSSRYLRAGH